MPSSLTAREILNASKTEAEFASKLGSGHLAVISLSRQMEEYQRLIFEELKRIAQSYQERRGGSEDNEEALSSSMSELVGANTATNRHSFSCVNWNANPDLSLALSEFPATLPGGRPAAILSRERGVGDFRCDPPQEPKLPEARANLSLSLFWVFLRAGIGALKEYRDRVFRVAAQVRDELGLEFLGMLPAIDQPVIDKESIASRTIKRQVNERTLCSAIRSTTPSRAFPRHCGPSRSRQI